MPKIIDHEQRKVFILQQAFSLFARHGYPSTSLSLLAQACNISRPTLYLYFRDKEEIFTYAVKYYTDEMFVDYRNVASGAGPVLPQIRRIMADIIFKSWHNRDFITSLGDYLFHKRKADYSLQETIHRRTVRIDYLLRRILWVGVRSGELRSIAVDSTAIQLLDFIYAYLFKMAILNTADPGKMISSIEIFLEGLQNRECECASDQNPFKTGRS